MNRFFSTLLVALFLAPVGLLAQYEEAGGEFSIDMNLRPRFEYRNGYNYPRSETDKPSAFISNRARVGMNFDNGFLSTRIAAQDISVWGQKPQNDNDGRFFTMHEAWAQMRRNGFFAKVGRQSLSYDDGRILSESGWTPTGIWHDALKLGYENEQHTAHLTLAYNQSKIITNQGSYYEAAGQPYQNMQVARYQYRSGTGLSIAGLFVNTGFEIGNPDNPNKAYMQTMGTNIGYGNNTWNVMGTAYYQTGTNADEKEMDAYMLALRGGYNFNKTFSMYGGMEFHPGQEADSDKRKFMNLLYRSNHTFMGSMDYFSGNDPYGVFDKYLGAKWNNGKGLALDLSFHNFNSHKVINVDGTDKKQLGSEIDFKFNYSIRKHIMLEGGYSFMLATDAMPIAKGRQGDTNSWQDWAYMSLTINPTVFKGRF